MHSLNPHKTINGNLELFELLFVRSKEKNPKDIFGITPHHSAAIKGHLEICKFIIKNVEQKNPATKNGFTPLYVAASNGCLFFHRHPSGRRMFPDRPLPVSSNCLTNCSSPGYKVIIYKSWAFFMEQTLKLGGLAVLKTVLPHLLLATFEAYFMGKLFL